VTDQPTDCLDTTDRELQCPNCSKPRFLATVSGTLVGAIEIRCRKCRQFTVFAADTAEAFPGRQIADVDPDDVHVELCEGCHAVLARWLLQGTGSVRIPCVRRDCKWNHRTRVDAQAEAEAEAEDEAAVGAVDEDPA
jgi:hypothetical protein